MQTSMAGSIGEPPANNSAERNYIDLHNNLVSAVWNQRPGAMAIGGYYMSQQANDPSASFPPSPSIGPGGYGSFGQLLQHASAGALYQHLNYDGHGTNYCTNHDNSAEHWVFQDEVHQVEGYEAGEDSGSETETGDENRSEDDPDASACDDGFGNDAFVGCHVATVHDDILCYFSLAIFCERVLSALGVWFVFFFIQLCDLF